MSKVVIFKGSPRKNGHIAKLLGQVAEGAKSKGAEVIEFVNDILEGYGWKLEDSIHYCGNSDAVFDELSLRAFKDGENLVG